MTIVRRLFLTGSRFLYFVIAGVVLQPCLQTTAFCDEPPSSNPAPVVRDVRLNARRGVEFSIVDQAGKPVAMKLVRVEFKGRAIAYARSNDAGKISVKGLRPGVHSLATGGQTTAFRLWDAASAPPSAVNKPAVVIGSEQLLGQYGPPMISPAMMATGVTATALAVVLGGKSSGTDHKVTPASP